MPGRCFGCAEEFGFFKREYDCMSCGRIFCSKCLPNSAVVPGKGKKPVKVCNDCYKKLTRKPAAVDVNQQTAQGPRTAQLGTQLGTCSDPGPSDPDEEIQRRLEKLRERDKHEEDISDKFEKLTGRKAASAQTNNINTFGPKKTEAEQMTDLLKQVQDECNIDERSGYNERADVTYVEDIEQRLDKLKGREPKTSGAAKGVTNYDYDSDDEAEFRKKYVQQAIAESFLDDKVRQQGYGDALDKAQQKTLSKEYSPPVDPDELPWCCICNENAVLRCHGCDDDLYCKRCFREGHDRFELREHTTSAYKPPRK